MISKGAFRRLTHPLLLRLWLKSSQKVVNTTVGGFRMRIAPGVFHPKYFGSSAILGEYVESMDLKGKTFLDMGTGSGIVGLFASRAGAIVTAVDVNPEAVECAQRNAAEANQRVEYRVSDLFSGLPELRFDVIAWNPPFFPKRPSSAAEGAFYAGENHEVIARFAREARTHLTNDGIILLVLSANVHVSGITMMFKSEGFTVRNACTRKWMFGETMIVIKIR